MLECSRLDPVRQNYLMKYSQYYLGIDAGVSTVIMSNPELLMQLLMESTSRLGVLKARQIDGKTYVELESVSKNCALLCIQKGYNS